MSHDTSFLHRRSPQRPSSSNHQKQETLTNEDDESESSYDSMNAFNVLQHSMRNRPGMTGEPAVQRTHKTWTEHQKFLQTLKLART